MRDTVLIDAAQDANEAAWEERRRHKRKPVLWAARVEAGAAAPVDAIILDLSLGGAKLRCPAKVAPKQAVALIIDRFGSLRSEVAWARSGMIGLRFTDDSAEIAKILGRTLPL